MSKRLQVVFDDEEYAEIQAAAKRARLTVSEWVRRALRQARGESHSLLELEGLGAELWEGEEDAAADHVARERDAWN